MSTAKAIQKKKDEILKKIASLGPMRKGSVCEQFQFATRKDGTRNKRGPYPMYTCKKKGKTSGKRLSKENEPLFRAQIDAFRQFQILCAQFAHSSEQLADREIVGTKKGKKNSRR